MRCLACFAVVVGLSSAAVRVAGAEATWSGQISDSLCGAKHEVAAEGEEKMTDGDCARACARGGSAFVLVSGATVYKIANQDFAGLAKWAGRPVSVTGDLKDDVVTVTRVAEK
jgi:hypothetical protein